MSSAIESGIAISSIEGAGEVLSSFGLSFNFSGFFLGSGICLKMSKKEQNPEVVVLEYLNLQNRPYNITDLMANLKGKGIVRLL